MKIVSYSVEGKKGIINTDEGIIEMYGPSLQNILDRHGNIIGREMYKEYDSTTICPGWIYVIL